MLAVGPIELIAALAAVAVALQSIEMILVRRALADDAIWSWPIMRQEFARFPTWARRFFDCVLSYRGFMAVLGVQLIAAVVLLLTGREWISGILLVTVVLAAVRFRGTFNGGSDYMTIIVLSALTVASLGSGHPKLVAGCLWYITLHLCSSFFVAGVVKLRRDKWRRGQALPGFMQMSCHEPPRLLASALATQPFAIFSSWVVIFFECSFPLALLSPELCLCYIAAAIGFQLMNFYVFGLNRFLFAWIAGYPALYWCSVQLS